MIMSGGYYYLVLVFVIAFVISFSSSSAYADRLTKLETEMAALNSRFDDFRDAINKRFEDLQHNMNNRLDDMNNRLDDMNNRLDDTNKRIDDVMFWLQFISGVLVLIIAGLVAQWIMMWKKVIGREAKVVGSEALITEHLKTETEKDRILALQRQEIDILKESINEIRKRLKMPEMAASEG